ncbi:MAG: S-layer homology domain-containing protein [Candidatus Peribacteraceae bacterium]|nr:S-layer homology domain-containing protein [Candidatus Peribacteraceae bacterium]MDD5074628.1 S-layer homology domain-containing protein [Candidatus Peribacteraceae bacterium]
MKKPSLTIGRCSGTLLVAATTLFFPVVSFAQSATFKDIPAGTPLAEAVTFLQSQGIIAGYADGTFRPNNKVNRAEAIKIIIAPLLKADALGQLKTTPFSDVKAGDWYLPYVEAARQNSIVDGPPAKTAFLGTQAVKKMEFVKMLLLAYRVDPNSYSEIRLPLSSDAADSAAWYYPYLRYALTSSMTMVSKDGLLEPARELTRGDTALLLHRFLMYRASRRTQALLSEAESEIIIVLGMLEANNLEQAEYASARALLAARGANASAPDTELVQGALKITESFRAIVRAYRAGVEKQFDESIRLSGEAWNLAARAQELSPTLAKLTEQVQGLSKKLADSARAAKAAPAPAKP